MSEQPDHAARLESRTRRYQLAHQEHRLPGAAHALGSNARHLVDREEGRAVGLANGKGLEDG